MLLQEHFCPECPSRSSPLVWTLRAHAAAAYNGIMPPEIKLQKDANGNVLTKPITAFGSARATLQPMRTIKTLIALTVLIMATGCAQKPTQQERFARVERSIHLSMVSAEMVGCAKPLTEEQKRYLLDLAGREDHATMQHYLLAVATTAQAACMQRKLALCETLTPGDCVAAEGE